MLREGGASRNRRRFRSVTAPASYWIVRLRGARTRGPIAAGGLAANSEPRTHMRPRGSCHSLSVACRWPIARAMVRKSYSAKSARRCRCNRAARLSMAARIFSASAATALLVAGFARRVRLAVDVIVDLGAVGIGIGDALVMFARDALRDGGVDADLGAGRHHAVALRQARIERLGARVGDDHHVAVALHAGGDRPFDFGRIVDVDVVVDHDDVLEVHHRERGEQRVLALAGLLPDRDHRVPERAAAERDVDVLDLHAGGLAAPARIAA